MRLIPKGYVKNCRVQFKLLAIAIVLTSSKPNGCLQQTPRRAASSLFVPNKMLLPLGVEHAPLPFALYRIEKE